MKMTMKHLLWALGGAFVGYILGYSLPSMPPIRYEEAIKNELIYRGKKAQMLREKVLPTIYNDGRIDISELQYLSTVSDPTFFSQDFSPSAPAALSQIVVRASITHECSKLISAIPALTEAEHLISVSLYNLYRDQHYLFEDWRKDKAEKLKPYAYQSGELPLDQTSIDEKLETGLTQIEEELLSPVMRSQIQSDIIQDISSHAASERKLLGLIGGASGAAIMCERLRRKRRSDSYEG